jgi:KaiC/GvpD/RAD55 family RecA-like ATPase
LSSLERVSIPLLAQLIPGGIKPGSIFDVQYDPESQWFAVATTIAARYLQSGGHVGYVAQARPLEAVKRDLETLGIDVSATIKNGRLSVDDWYSATLMSGRLGHAGDQASFFEPIEGGVRARSLRIADLSIEWQKELKHDNPEASHDVEATWPPGSMSICESESEILRFNEENAFVEWKLGRNIPYDRREKRISLFGLVRGIHSESFYRRIESAVDGVVDCRVLEQGDESKSFLRIRSIKGQPYDGRWHEIEIKQNGEAALKT